MKWIISNLQMLSLMAGLLSVTSLGAGLWGISQGKKIANAENAQLEKTARHQAQTKAVKVINSNDKNFKETQKYISEKPREINPVLPNYSDLLIRLHNSQGNSR